MKNHCLKLIVSMCSCLFYGCAYACPGTPAPVHLLGGGIGEHLEVVDVGMDPDLELIDVHGLRWERKFIVDKNRNYFYLDLSDGLIESIIFNDRCLTTEEGIRVGDPFSKVMSVYPDAKFRHGDKAVDLGQLDMLVNDGKVEFLFNDYKVMELIGEGYKVGLNDEVVKAAKVFLIKIYQ